MNLNKANGWSSILGRTLNAFERNRCKFLNNLVFSETMQNKDVYNLLLMKKKRNRPAFSVSCKGNKYKTYFQYLK